MEKIMSKNLKNFYRVSQVLAKKCDPLFGIACDGLGDFIGEKGKQFFINRGQKAYMRTARFYWRIINN